VTNTPLIAACVTSALVWTGLSYIAEPTGSASWLGVTTVYAADHKKIGKTECTDCHGELIKHAVMHAPAEGCETCHEYSEDGAKAQVNFTIKGNELCFTCHTEKQEELQKKPSKHPPAEDDCSNCHDPHSSDNPRMLKMPLNELCVTCHTERQEEFDKKKFSHSPVRELGCITCHDPHATNNKPLLKAEPNSVCLACHRFKRSEPTYGPDEKLMIFPGTPIPAAYPNKARKVILGSDGNGHPFIGHPVGGIPDPSHKERQLSCVSCHDPHAGNFRQMFQKDIRGQELCLRCHK
jgi:predicted CXXCH cytochrome family protein